MKRIDVLAAACLLALAASVAFWFWSRPGAPPPPRASGPFITVESVVDPDYRPVARDTRLPRGVVGFDAEGAGIVGVGVATLFKDNAGEVHLGQWYDVTGAQYRGALDLRRWLRTKRPTGVWHLRYAVWLDRDGVRESREGWAKISTSQLRVVGLRVRAPARERMTIAVVTGAGQLVPGALIALDHEEAPPTGLVSHLAHTDESGLLHLSGLDRGVRYTARLVDGAGPATDPIVTKFETPTPRIELVVADLVETWTFIRHEARFAVPGGSTRIREVEFPGRPDVVAWPVSHWIGPGRGLTAPVYFMTTSRDPAAATLRFANREQTVQLPDVQRPQLISFPLGKETIRVTARAH